MGFLLGVGIVICSLLIGIGAIMISKSMNPENVRLGYDHGMPGTAGGVIFLIFGFIFLEPVLDGALNYGGRLIDEVTSSGLLTVLASILAIPPLLLMGLFFALAFGASFDIAWDSNERVQMWRLRFRGLLGLTGCITPLVYFFIYHREFFKIGLRIGSNPFLIGLVTIMISVTIVFQEVRKYYSHKEHCDNCGHEIRIRRPNKIFNFHDGGVFGRLIGDSPSPIYPITCACGLPIFSNTESIKETRELFWISNLKFDRNLWNLEQKGLFSKLKSTYEFAIRVVNERQVLDETIQFKLVGKDLFVQQHGIDIIVEHLGTHDVRIVIVNKFGVENTYVAKCSFREGDRIKLLLWITYWDKPGGRRIPVIDALVQ